jgi:hypothetical protein
MRRPHREVPPEVTTGRVVVVAGGTVVGGRVVDVVDDTAGTVAELGLTAVVVVGGTVVEDRVVDGRISGTEDVAEPGCSRATTPAMTAVAPVAIRTAVEVRRRILVWTRAGETGWSGRGSLACERSTILVQFLLACSRGSCHRRHSSWPQTHHRKRA